MCGYSSIQITIVIINLSGALVKWTIHPDYNRYRTITTTTVILLIIDIQMEQFYTTDDYREPVLTDKRLQPLSPIITTAATSTVGTGIPYNHNRYLLPVL